MEEGHDDCTEETHEKEDAHEAGWVDLDEGQQVPVRLGPLHEKPVTVAGQPRAEGHVFHAITTKLHIGHFSNPYLVNRLKKSFKDCVFNLFCSFKN